MASLFFLSKAPHLDLLRSTVSYMDKVIQQNENC